MNERIIELADKAVEDVSSGPWNISDEFCIKFAHLIVQECADICMEMATKCAGLEGDGALAKDCAYWIKKHFGVEE